MPRVADQISNRWRTISRPPGGVNANERAKRRPLAASRPFVNHLPHLLLLGALLLAAVALSAWNATLFLSTRSETRAVQTQLQALAADETRLARRREELARRLQGVDLAELRTDVASANDVLSQRAVQWTTLLERLEDVMPYQAALSSIRQSTGPAGVKLSLEVRSLDQERYLRLLETMEESPCFSNAYPRREEKAGNEFEVSLEASYDPFCGEQRPVTMERARGRRQH